MPPLEAKIAEIDAARLGADGAFLDQLHARAAARQEQGGPGPHQAAAHDGDIGRRSGHGDVSMPIATATGLTGA